MADNIEIRVDDKASGSSDKIAASLIKMADASDKGSASLVKLKQALNGLGSNSGLSKLNAELNKLLPALTLLSTVMQKSTTEAAKLALANQRLASEQAKTAAATAKVATAQNQAATAAQRLATEQARTAAAEARAATAAAQAESAARRLATAQKETAAANNTLNTSFSSLTKSALAFVGIGFGANEILETVNAYTALQNKLQIVSDSQQQVNELTGRLGQVAIETRSDLEATVTSFARFDAALQSLGKSQEESLRLTETVNKLFVVGGATAAEQAGALIQLSQAFNANVLQGEEYRSLAENMPKAVRTAIASVLKINESALKQAASAGQITGQVLFEAFKKLDQFADSKFAKTIPTLGQALNVFRTQATLAAGELDKKFGVSSAIAQGVIYLGDHLKELSVIMAGVGTASILAFGPQFLSLLGAARNAVVALTVAMASNPLGAVAVALASAATYVALFGDEVSTSADGFVTLKDSALGTFDVISSGFGDLYDYLNGELNDAFSSVTSSANDMSISLGSVVDDIADVFKTLVNAIIGSFDAAFYGIVQVFSATPTELLGIFNVAARGIIQIIEDLVNTIASALNQLFSGFNDLASKVGIDQIFNTDLKVDLTSAKDLFSSAGDEYGSALVTGMVSRINRDYVGDVGKAIGGASQTRAVDRLIDDLASGSASTLRGSGQDTTGGPAQKKKKAAKKTDLQKAQEAILKEATGGLKEYNLQLTAANNLLASGQITQDQYNRVVLKASETYKNAADPMREINKSLSDQQKLYESLPADRTTDQQAQQIQNELLSKGIVLNKSQTEALRDRIKAMQEMQQVAGYRDQIYSENQGGQKDLQNQATAYTQAFATGEVGAEKFQIKLNEINLAMANLNLQMGDGTFADGLVASLGKVTEGYEGVASGLTSTFGDFFTSFSQGFADSIGQAIVSGDNLGESLQNVAQNAIGSLISSLIQLGIQYAINAALGNAFGQASTAAAVGQAAVISAAYATPAALVSLASFGANSVPASAGIASTVALSQGLSVVGSAGFMTGGYTGNGATDAIAGAVHGQEYVFDAASTKAIGVDNLEALRSGAKSLNSSSKSAGKAVGGIGDVKIDVQNTGTPQTYQAQQVDENTIRLWARDEAQQEVKTNAGNVAARDMRNPNSKLSKAQSQSTTATRRRN
ncbi:tape measure protein [Erwinia phage AH03]|uniref:Tape measure protein n=1 Tax=Erwinia phage AH03 TaxID=2869568 RepID=A0AAE7X1G8_9CAUD|nr:tape measure protein [Erwinia phage AH03]